MCPQHKPNPQHSDEFGEVQMSEEELELLITIDDPGEDTLEEDTFHHQPAEKPVDLVAPGRETRVTRVGPTTRACSDRCTRRGFCAGSPGDIPQRCTTPTPARWSS